ncbi:hypothetical protein PMAYCL1PPCAC_07328, partial [Pristionchus mayeri]
PLLMTHPTEMPVASLMVSPHRTQSTTITDLPVEILGLIFDMVDDQTRANARMTHPHLSRGVWEVENRRAMECISRGVTLPPKAFFRRTAKLGIGINYRVIRDFNVFGSNLAGRCDRFPLMDVVRGPFLPPLKDEEGNLIHSGHNCFRIAPQLLNMERNMNFNVTGKISLGLDLQKYGFSVELLRTNLVQFTATISGIQRSEDADLSVAAGLLHKNGKYNKYALMTQEREEEEIPTWGKGVTLKLETPLIYTSDGIFNELTLQITLMNNFILYAINIRAMIQEIFLPP